MPKVARPCTIPGCDKPVWARGWCPMHYRRWYLHGDPLPYRPIRRYGHPTERWRDVIGEYRGVYEVSDFGRVRRVARGRGAGKVGVPFAGAISTRGYLRVALSYRGRSKSYYVHRLVTAAFIGPCPAGHVVNHKDGDKTNNTLTNLEYVTPAENLAHAEALGLMPYSRD